MAKEHNPRPLDGIRVIEVGQLLAGPFTGSMLGYYGAEVIKVETPGEGDPIRKWRIMKDGTALWWSSLARNKKCITANLRTDEGREIVARLAETADVVVENFRPGTMEKWGLGPAELQAKNPGLIYARISGYGQTGPYASKPGFASVCEGFGGFRYVNGFPGDAPVRPNLSIGDTLAGIHTVLGILLAVIRRKSDPEGKGQVIDTAIYEAVFNLLEGVVPEFDGAGVVREPSGSTLTGIVPTNTYRCKDGKYVIIGGNGDSIFKRLCHAMGRDDLGDDPRMADNAGRVEHEKELDDAISAWTGTLTADELQAQLDEARVPGGPIYSVVDMMADAQYQARGMFETVQVGGEDLKIAAMVPKLSDTPGRTDWPGPEVGAHNDEVFGSLLGMTSDQIKDFQERGII
jgi:crotonobetainyl-CoA:carnitine CoA-transferase CaiB-like acyl-CoA transferase